METILIKDDGLTCYYLEQKFQDEPESGLKFTTTPSKDGEDEKTVVTLNYEDKKDLDKKRKIMPFAILINKNSAKKISMFIERIKSFFKFTK